MERFSDVEAIEFDRMKNLVTIFRKDFKPEVCPTCHVNDSVFSHNFYLACCSILSSM